MKMTDPINTAKFIITTDILNITDKCRANFSCLNGSTECLCTVKEYINHAVLFIEPADSMCQYYLAFGYSQICLCPTRMELFKKYGR